MSDEELLESLMIQIWAIYRSGGDPDLGAAVAVQMREVCDRLPVPSPSASASPRSTASAMAKSSLSGCRSLASQPSPAFY
jgi:hypothetical protein